MRVRGQSSCQDQQTLFSVRVRLGLVQVRFGLGQVWVRFGLGQVKFGLGYCLIMAQLFSLQLKKSVLENLPKMSARIHPKNVHKNHPKNNLSTICLQIGPYWFGSLKAILSMKSCVCVFKLKFSLNSQNLKFKYQIDSRQQQFNKNIQLWPCHQSQFIKLALTTYFSFCILLSLVLNL